MKPISSILVATVLLSSWSLPAAAQEVRVATVSAAEYVPVENRYPLMRLGLGATVGYGGIRQMVSGGLVLGAQLRAGLQLDLRNGFYWEAVPVFAYGRNGKAMGVDNLVVYEYALGRFVLGVGLGASINGYLGPHSGQVPKEGTWGMDGPVVQAPMMLLRLGVLMGQRQDESNWSVTFDIKPFPAGGTNGIFLSLAWDRR
jgi:hypothetical protein